MMAADMPAIEVQRADLLAVYMALAEFGRKRAERRADRSTNMAQHDDDHASVQHEAAHES